MIPVAYPLTVIPNTLGMYLFNAGAREGGGLSVSRFRRILDSSLLLQAVMTIAFLVVIRPGATFVYGTEFAPAVVFAMWRAPVATIKGIVQGSLVGQIVCFFGLSIFVHNDAKQIDRLQDSIASNDSQTIPAPE